MIVTEATSQDNAAWDRFVENSPHGLPHHLAGWRTVLQKTYGYDTPYLIATESEEVRGVMPLYVIRSRLVGHFATTMQGGLLAADETVTAALLDRAREVSGRLGAKQVVLQDTRQVWPGPLATACHHVHWVVPVPADEEALRAHVNRNIRRQVRRSRENGLTVEVDRAGRRVVDFYEVMSRFTHQMGTPIYGRDFVENVVQAFPRNVALHFVRRDQKVVAAYLNMELGGTVHGLWGATLHEYRSLGASYLAYWEILLDAGRRGCTTLDLGRSPEGSTASAFKAQWGGHSHPVCQQVLAVNGSRPDTAISSRVRSDDRFQLFSRVWSRLPLAAHRALGPRLRRHVPFA